MKPLLWFQVIYSDHINNRRYGKLRHYRYHIQQEIAYRAIRRWKPLYIVRIIPKDPYYTNQPPRRLEAVARL
jgi:hypothetical protein